MPPPPEVCPECGKPTLIVMMVAGDQFAQRCTRCPAERLTPLPKLQKKIIYLDQFALSKMLAAINPAWGKSGKVDPRWAAIYERLDVLAKGQVVVCPDSGTQMSESMVHARAEELRSFSKYLSHGVSFLDEETIERFQVLTHFRSWLAGKPDEVPVLSVDEVTHGGHRRWSDTFAMIALVGVRPEDVEALRSERDSLHDGLNAAFERWKNMEGRTFEQFFEAEVRGFGNALLYQYAETARRLAEFNVQGGETGWEEFAFASGVVLVTAMLRDLDEAGVPSAKQPGVLRNYFDSLAAATSPAVKLSCMLWAAVARKAAGGMKTLSRGEGNDITVVSAVLPYCDAMVIDRRMKGYLEDEPIKGEVRRFPVRLFTEAELNEFVSYLDELRSEVAEEHRKLVERVYGPAWLVPYNPFVRER